MVRVITPIALSAVLALGGAVTSHAAEQPVRLIAGVAAAGDNHHDVTIHRIPRDPYDPRDYRRVAQRSNFFGHRSGRTPGGMARPEPKADPRQTRYERDTEERWRRDRWRLRDRVVVIFIAPKPKKVFPGPHGHHHGSDHPPSAPPAAEGSK